VSEPVTVFVWVVDTLPAEPGCHCKCKGTAGCAGFSPPSPLPPALQVTVGLKPLDIYNNVMHMVLDNGLVLTGDIKLCYVIECEQPGAGYSDMHACTAMAWDGLAGSR
jgi:hypothetical protein